MPVKYTSTFRAPSEYERQIEEARRRQMLAEVLAQQQYEPSEGNAAPIPRAAPLVKALQSYLTARQATQARQAGEEAKAMEGDYAQRMLGRMEGGYTYDPKAQPVTVPEQTQLEEVTRQSQYKRSPEQALQMASTTIGAAALKDRPVMAARLAQMLETPKTAKYGTTVQYDDKGQGYVVSEAGDVKILPGVTKTPEPKTPAYTGGKFYNYETKKWEDIPGYVEQQSRIAAASRGPESLVMVDVNGTPILTPRSQAVGKPAFVNKPPSITGDDKVDRRKHRDTRIQLQNAYDSISEFAKELQNTPKEASLYGEAAGRLSSKYKLALGAVRVLQNTGVLNPGELPFIEDTLRNPQSFTQLFNPASRKTIVGQINSIADLLEKQSATNDELFEYDITPLKGREWRALSIPAKAKAAGLTQADWDAATEEERAAWR